MKAVAIVAAVLVIVIAGALIVFSGNNYEMEELAPAAGLPAVPDPSAASQGPAMQITGDDKGMEAGLSTVATVPSAPEEIEPEPELTTPELLANLRLERDPQTIIELWQKLRRREGVNTNPEVVQVAIELMASGISESQHAGYSLLSQTGLVTPELVEEVRYMANDANDPLIRIAALSVFGDWLEKHPDQHEFIMDSTLKIATEDEDERVRGAAVQMIVLDDIEPTDDTVAAVSRMLIADESASNRRLAAMGLGNVQEEIWKPFLVDQIKQAYASETEASVKRELLKSIMQLSTSDGREFINNLEPETDPELVDDIERIKQQGEEDVSE